MNPLNPRLLATVIAVFASTPFVNAATPASGKVGDWTVVDAIAWRDKMGTHIVVSDKPFDRNAIGSDLKINSLDVVHHQMPPLNAQTYELGLDAEGKVGGTSISMPGGALASSSNDMSNGLKLDKNDGSRVAGSFVYAPADIRFDVPVVSGVMPRPGKPLPADGGEPGKALNAQIIAIAKGDIHTLVKLSPPEHRESTLANAEAEVEYAQQNTPSKVTITGGSIDGDRAWIDFDGVQGGQSMQGLAIVERADGAWYVRKIEARKSE